MSRFKHIHVNQDADLHSPRKKKMRKIAPLITAFSLSLLLSTAAFGGEILTPGSPENPVPPPLPAALPSNQVAGASLPGIEFIYDLFVMVF